MRKIAGFVLSLLLVLGAYSFVEAQKVKTVNGVKHIINDMKPKAPKGAPTKVTFQEEISVGAGDDPETSFAEVGFFVVADNGNIYALDVKDRKIKVYDAEGNFVRKIGKPGQGPGELQMPSNIQLTMENELLIEDAANRRLTFFSMEGEFVRHQNIVDRLGLTRLVLDGKGNYAGQEIGLDGQEMFFELKKFDKDLQPLFSVDKIQFKLPIPGSGVKMNPMDFVKMYAYMFDSKGNLYHGSDKDYEIKIFDQQGKHVRSIKRKYKPVKITQKDIDEMMERMEAFSGLGGGINIMDMFEFPDYFSPYQSFILDDQDRIYVRTWERGKNEREYWMDVFDKEGRFFTRFVTTIEIHIWNDDTVYGIEEDEEGFRVIKRFGVTWSK